MAAIRSKKALIRFTRAVAFGNPQGFTQIEKEEQELAEACNRLVKNSRYLP